MSKVAANEAALDLIVQRIREHVQPDLIILFGSRATGATRDDSDYDLMLVLPDDVPVEAARRAACQALRGTGISADILAHSAGDYAWQQHDPGLLPWLVSREGRVLYSTGRVPQRSAPRGRVRERPTPEGLAMWIRRAEADLREAEMSLASADPVWDAICFHSHACVEKLLKALTVKRGAFPPRTHDLEQLLQVQAPDLRENAALAGSCGLLMALFPRSRYPNLVEPTPDEARLAIAAARDAHTLLRPRLDD